MSQLVKQDVLSATVPATSAESDNLRKSVVCALDLIAAEHPAEEHVGLTFIGSPDQLEQIRAVLMSLSGEGTK